MRELMLELLCYEPFGKLISKPDEKEYIHEILSGNYNPPQTTLHTLFSGFYSCVQQGNLKNVGWLRAWKVVYGRASPPLLFKKICFYLLVKGGLSQSDFMRQIGLHASYIRKWGISPQFRKYAEEDTYSCIKIFRNGVKKEYIVSTVKQLYYEAGRQVYDIAEADRQASESKVQSEKGSKTSEEPPWFVKCSMKLNNLPQFVDVFAGSASVAASVVTEGCKKAPIVNDKDPVIVCFAWSFVHCKSELRKRIVDFHNYVINQELKSLSYDEDDYEGHNNPDNLSSSPKTWDDPQVRQTHIDHYLYSEDDIARDKMLAQRYQEFIMRIRSSYIDVVNALALNDRDRRDRLRDELRCKINFNKLSPRCITQIEEDVLDYALAIFYCCSFAGGKAGNVYHETFVNASSYFSYLSKIHDLGTIRKDPEEVKARKLAELQLEASSLILESKGHFSKYLQKAEFYSKDFRKLLKITPSDAVYYWDSPYYLTTGYDVGFSDKDHKDMLDILRNAKFKWIFSMQYNPSYRYWCSTSQDEAERKKQPYIIRDYGDYYRGFCAPLQEVGDQRAYVVDDAQTGKATDLYVILFDFDKVKQKWPKMRTETREMLVVNFNPLRTIPLHDSAVVYPFDLFLQCADKKMEYPDIVKRAIAWRKANIESKYADKVPV